ncbi:MAG: glycogen/starch/alpha-glucan phosphorylase [Butyricicoccus pullicaecorum]|nr:glycogen/starch/alpha-glucan phosphorylase [Butyricicoccus pullicaecorum]
MYLRPENRNDMSLTNIAGSGRFAADRAVAECAQNIWRVHTSFSY